MTEDLLETAKKAGGFRASYKAIKSCVLKKELGESSQECKSLWKNLGIEEVGNEE